MNLVDHFVLEILSKPKQEKYGFSLEVLVDCYGSKFNHTLYGDTEEELLKIKVGDKFLA